MLSLFKSRKPVPNRLPFDPKATRYYADWPSILRPDPTPVPTKCDMHGDEMINLWMLRAEGVAIRNMTVPTPDDFKVWLSLWTVWEGRVFLACERAEAGAWLKEWLRVLNETGETVTDWFYDAEHELYVRCLSEQLRRLERYLVSRFIPK